MRTMGEMQYTFPNQCQLRLVVHDLHHLRFHFHYCGADQNVWSECL